MERDYSDRVKSELDFYEDQESVHDFPESQHYINENHLRPLLVDRFPYGRFDEMVLHFYRLMKEWIPDRPLKVLSLGSGNCDFEINLVVENGLDCYVHCLELNLRMLDRAAESAKEKGVSRQFRFMNADANELSLGEEYDLVIAYYALHHFVALEHIFEQVHNALMPHSLFLVNDMIGRNGHLFWDSTLEFCRRIWNLLPKDMKYNHQLREQSTVREQWDCAQEGFEGIRAQDILPLLDRYFNFLDFAPFYAFVNRFTDRDYGPNFNPENPLHRAFLDLIWQLDNHCCANRLLKPTQMMACVVRKDVQVQAGRFLYFPTPSSLYELPDAALFERFDPLPGGEKPVDEAPAVVVEDQDPNG